MLSIQTDYSTLTAVLGRRAHSHREALSSAAFVADQVLRSCSSYGEDSLDALQYMHGEWWSPCIYRRNQNDSSPLELQLRRWQNPPQTFRVRERSKRGYASRLLVQPAGEGGTKRYVSFTFLQYGSG